MMSLWKMIVAGSCCLAAGALAGCDRATTKEDVEKARKEYEQQAQEAQEASRDAQKEVGKEVREADQAYEQLQEKKAEYASEQSRTDYVEHQNRELERSETVVSELKGRSKHLEGDAKSSLDDKIKVAEEKIDVARDKLAELKSAGVDEWTAKRDDVELAMKHVDEQLTQAQNIR